MVVRDRAGGQCEAVERGMRCPAPGTDCDHVRPGNDHSYANLQWLCGPHHAVKSAREGAQARVPLHRPPERHPGIV
ncbi:HNH endonuclease signature motif containing protein [Actinoplanes sp. NPDC026623]|uniref:HNH endonuclease signature motif containing protein n=1 Tax=Actinoplanes sp. NPDC026623 TaxID=3155610 RepID=UPI0033D9DFB6